VAVASRVASCLNDALDLTPAQIIAMCDALGQLGAGKGRRSRRYGTKEEFKAMLLGMLG